MAHTHAHAHYYFHAHILLSLPTEDSLAPNMCITFLDTSILPVSGTKAVGRYLMTWSDVEFPQRTHRIWNGGSCPPIDCRRVLISGAELTFLLSRYEMVKLHCFSQNTQAWLVHILGGSPTV